MFFSSRKKETPKKEEPEKQKMEDFDKKWEIIEKGIWQLVEYVELLRKGKARHPYDYKDFSNLYTIVYTLCTQKVENSKSKMGSPHSILYEKCKEFIQDYLTKMVANPLKKKEQEVLLTEAVSKWTDHQLIVKWLKKLFDYLDRYYTKHNNRDSLKDVGLKCYQKYVYGSVKNNMAVALLEKIMQERDGEIVEKNILKEGIHLFVEMGLGSLQQYQDDFEKMFLQRTTEYYRALSQKWLSEDSAPEYLKKTEFRLVQEEERANNYLHESTKPQLIRQVEEVLIAKNTKQLLEMENSGFLTLLKDMRFEDLARMFQLFKRVGELKPMADLFREHITVEGMKILEQHQQGGDQISATAEKKATEDATEKSGDKDEEKAEKDIDCTSFIESLLRLHETFSSLANNQFEKEPLFLDSLKDAFTNIVNKELVHNKKKRTITTAELLSSYCDNVMRNTEKYSHAGASGASSSQNLASSSGASEIEDLLENVVKLFGYISDKDMFQEFYRRQLSKRLLTTQETSLNLEMERNLISKLKIRCGAVFTSKLEGMIKDKTISEDLQKEFQNHLDSKEKNIPQSSEVAESKEIVPEKKKILPCEFSTKILTTGFWPSFKIDTALILPEELQRCVDEFKVFYDSKTQSRSLKWVHSLGTATILARYENGNKDLSTSTYQACLLLQFNKKQAIKDENESSEENEEIISLTTEQIMKNLNLNADEVKRNLLSLCVSKNAKILNKTGSLKVCGKDDKFSVNFEFKSLTKKIKIPNLIMVITEKERNDVGESTQEERKHAIEAAIVRIMKARKEMKHQDLVLEVSKQLMHHFNPDPKQIKQRIEDLIARDYLERDEQSSDTYRYLA